MNTLVVTLVVMVVCIAKATVQGQCDSPGELVLSAKAGNDTFMTNNIFTANDKKLNARAIYKPDSDSEFFTLTGLMVSATHAKIVKVVGIVAATGERVKAKTRKTATLITLAQLPDLGSDLTFKKLTIQAKPRTEETVSFQVIDIIGC